MIRKYGIVISGLPGSGKTTLTNRLQEICKIIKRNVKVINIDPSSSNSEFDFDIQNIIQTMDAQETIGLGPNGALHYCLEVLEQNVGILTNYINQQENCLFLFDLPGQIECFISHFSIRNVLFSLQQQCKMDIVIVNLADINLINTSNKYLQYQLQTISLQCALSYPLLNYFNKVDLLQNNFEQIIENYEEDLILTQNALSLAIVEVINLNGVMNSIPLSCLDSKQVTNLLIQCDYRIGYVRGEMGEYTGMQQQQIKQIEEYIKEACDMEDCD